MGIMSPWLFIEEGEDGGGKEGREWRLPDRLYPDDLVLYGEEEDLREMVGRFVEVCRRRELKVTVMEWRGVIRG